MVEFPTFIGSWPWPWIRAWSLPFFISHRVLPVYQISSKSKKLFVDGQTHGRTDGNLPPIVLGRLPKFGSRPKKLRGHLTILFCSLPSVVVCNTKLQAIIRLEVAIPAQARWWRHATSTLILLFVKTDFNFSWIDWLSKPIKLVQIRKTITQMSVRNMRSQTYDNAMVSLATDNFFCAMSASLLERP